MENRLFVCGDLHGSHDIEKLNTRNFPKQKELTKDDVLVQLGDFGGIWYPRGVSNEQEYWLDWIASKKFTTAVVLGNHENYDVIEKFPWEEKWDNEVQFYTTDTGDKIYFLKRGAIYNINGRKILAIGGAFSIDKAQRNEGISWWAQEDITPKEVESCFCELDEKGYEVDYVLTHTCPARIVSEFIHLSMRNVGKVNDYTAEFLNEIDNLVEFKEWHFGHFHLSHTYTETSDDGKDTDIYTCHYNNPVQELK